MLRKLLVSLVVGATMFTAVGCGSAENLDVESSEPTKVEESVEETKEEGRNLIDVNKEYKDGLVGNEERYLLTEQEESALMEFAGKAYDFGKGDLNKADYETAWETVKEQYWDVLNERYPDGGANSIIGSTRSFMEKWGKNSDKIKRSFNYSDVKAEAISELTDAITYKYYKNNKEYEAKLNKDWQGINDIIKK